MQDKAPSYGGCTEHPHEHDHSEGPCESCLNGLKEAVDRHAVAITNGGDEHTLVSIGFSKQGFPDILVSCRDPHAAARLINMTFCHWVEHGYRAGRNNDLIVGKGGEDMPVEYRLVDTSDERTGYCAITAQSFYKRFPEYYKGGVEGPTFVQMLWPDNAGRLPTEEGYNSERFPQTVLTAKATQ